MARVGMIDFFDYRPQLDRYRDEFDAAIARVLASGRLILGEEVEAFEEEFARFVGVAHAVGVGTGTDALTLSLRALEIGPGDEVVTVANAGVAPIAGIRASGASLRLVDVDPDTLLLDPTRLEAALGPNTRAIVAVHLYGNPVDLGAVLDVASSRGISVVEDCAQAHGARWQGRSVGGLGCVGCFSFYPTKNIGAFGDGGICVTDDPGRAARIREQRMYGFHGDGFAHVEGRNSRLDELQAAILRVKLAHFEADLAERRALAQLYTSELEGAPVVPVSGSGDGEHAYHLFVVRSSIRESVQAALEEARIGSAIHYPVPVHKMDAYSFLDRPGELEISEQASQEVLSLPLYPGLSQEAVGEVGRALRESPGGLKSSRP